MKTGEPLDCPFCHYTDHDHYFLLQHVETTHPEGGRPSPFTVREHLIHQVDQPAEEMEGTKDTSSEYTECQCGESCLLTEFESHLEMHYAEGLGWEEPSRAPADSAAPNSTIYPSKASSSQADFVSPTPFHIVTSGPSRPIPIRSVVERSQRGTSRKNGNALRDLVDVLRHPTSLPSKNSSRAARNRVPRRLGVRNMLSYVFQICILIADHPDRELS